ncbi:MAG: PIN domain-containing protein [Cyanobacteria bacterium P01_C01_bin.120]
MAILEQCETANWTLVSSTAIESEIDQTPDPIKRQRLIDSLAIASKHVIVTESIMVRASDLKMFGFKAFDALHIACAESAGVDTLLTTDDRLLRKAISQRVDISVRVANPVMWFMDISNR